MADDLLLLRGTDKLLLRGTDKLILRSTGGASTILPQIASAYIAGSDDVRQVTKDSTNVSVELYIVDSTTGAPETGVVFNTSGIDLNYRRDGAAIVSITEIDLTTPALTDAHEDGGFLEIGNGRYRLDVPDAAFATGVDQVTIGGTVTGMVVLPVTVQLVDFDLGSSTVDVGSISGDSTAADNLELMYDGTGYTDETAPASRTQVNAIGAASGGSVNIEATEDNTGGAIIDSVTFVGSVQSGTFSSTESENGVYHDIDDTANDIDIVYGYSVGGSRSATSVAFAGFCQGNSDEIKIKAYDHVGADWEIIGTIPGQSGTANISLDLPLLLKHTGTGSELGKVYVRFDTDSTTPSNLSVDKLIVSAVNIGQTIGYANGSVWVDTSLSNTNTESFVDGVADNPVSTIAAALTIAAAVGLKRITFAAGSSVTLAADMSNYELMGNNWTLAFGGQTITGAKILGATVSGTFVGTTAILENCIINAITGPGTTMRFCYFNEVTITANGAGNWYLNDCRSRVAGSAHANFDFGAGVGNTGLSMRSYSGGIELENMGDTGTDTATIEGDGAVTINANCDGGSLSVRGNLRVTDNSSNVTLTITPDVAGYQEGAVWVDESAGTSSGTTVGVDGVFRNQSDDFDNAQDIADALGTSLINIAAGNTVTLSDSLEGYRINMVQVTLDGGTQDVGSTRFNEGTYQGVFTRTSGFPSFADGRLFGASSLSLPQFVAFRCGVVGTLTLTEAANQSLIDCQGNGATIDCGSLGSGLILNLVRWTGSVTLNNLASGAVVNARGIGGGNLILNGADATVNVDGVWSVVTNNLTGSPTVTDSSITLANINAEADTAISDASLATASALSTAQADLDIITGADGVNLLSATQTSIDAIETDTGTTLPATLTTIEGKIDTVDTVADGIQTDLSNGTDGLGALKALIDTIDGIVDDILVDTAEIGAAGAGLTGIPWNSAWDAEVESEVNDALDTAISELGVGAPSATPSLRTGMMLMYMALRNKLVVQTSGTDALEVHNDAGTKIASKLITDDGSDYTEAEMT